jgi:hypothetical protein
VDVTPDVLQQRLREGKVYRPEQAERAARHFFTRGNLIALRELALRIVAERVDAQMLDFRRENAVRTPWPASERILVCVSASPLSARLVRAAKRLASGLRAPCLAVHVETPAAIRLPVKERQRLERNLRLAEQLGAQVDMLGADDLAWGNLGQYDAIVTGVRAYERRADLRANNDRLLAYARAGGTLIVQYNKFEFNEAQYGPYPAKVSSNRVTNENAPITVLVPSDPIFHFPNRIGNPTWKNWVQERGLYFLGDDKDPRYVDLVQTQDPFPYNSGVKKGALVEAKVGQGRWIYVGLGLWRQLPAGTDGAYQLLENLLSAGKAR